MTLVVDVVDSETVVAAMLTVLATVGEVDASATGEVAAVTVVAFCVTAMAGGAGGGRTIGTLFVKVVGLGGGIGLTGMGVFIWGGGGMPPPLLIGGVQLGFLPPPPGPSTLAHTCVLVVKCPSWTVTYR